MCGLLVAMELTFDPSKWHSCENHDWRSCAEAINCYAYVLNRPDYHWAVPGHRYAKTKTQHYFTSYDANFKNVSQAMFRRQLIDGAQRDGLVRSAELKTEKGYYVAALFFEDQGGGLDFHWYRQDDDGTWSHKDGWRAVANKTVDGRAIYDPRYISDTNYPIFGGFFLAPRAGVTLERKFPLLP